MSTFNFWIEEMNFDRLEIRFYVTSGEVKQYYIKEISSSSTKAHISTIKVLLHYPKVEGGDELIASIRILYLI